MTQSISDSIFYDRFKTPYLNDKQNSTYLECIKFLSCYDPKVTSETALAQAFEQLSIYEKREKKRKVTIAFLEKFFAECEEAFKLLKFLKAVSMRKNVNDNDYQMENQESIRQIDIYFDFISGLKKSALTIQNAFFEKIFDKGIKQQFYPRMMKELAMLLKKADMEKCVDEILDEQIRKDLLFALQDDKAAISIPAKFNSLSWVMFLKNLSDKTAGRILFSVETQEKTYANRREQAPNLNLSKMGSNLRVVATKVDQTYDSNNNKKHVIQSHPTSEEISEVLFQLSSFLENMIYEYGEQKKECEKRHQGSHFEEHCVDFFSGLNNLAKQTQEAYNKNGFGAVKVAYPNMIEGLINLLVKTNFLQLIDKIPSCWFKNDLQRQLKNKEVIFDSFDLIDWLHYLNLLSIEGYNFIRPIRPIIYVLKPKKK